MDVNSTAPEMPKPAQLITASICLFLDDLLHSGVDRIFIGHIDRQMGDTLHRDISAAELIDDAAVLFQADAVHRPMPELPPVTITTLLFSPAMIFLLKMLIWFEYTASQDDCLYG